jgi:hypothetical protein
VLLQVELKGEPEDVEQEATINKFGRPLQPAQLDHLTWGPHKCKALMVANCGTCKSSWNA